MGFIVLSLPYIIFLFYVAISVLVIRWLPRGWVRWLGAALVLLVWFWDLPLLGYYKYECVTNGGFREYKSFEQWQSENPGAEQSVLRYEKTKRTVLGNTDTFQDNDRIAWKMTRTQLLGIMERLEQQIVDLKTNEILARNTDYRIGPLSPSIWNIEGYKFWLNSKSCGYVSDYVKFNGVYDAYQKLGRAE